MFYSYKTYKYKAQKVIKQKRCVNQTSYSNEQPIIHAKLSIVPYNTESVLNVEFIINATSLAGRDNSRDTNILSDEFFHFMFMK